MMPIAVHRAQGGAAPQPRERAKPQEGGSPRRASPLTRGALACLPAAPLLA